MVVGPYSKGLVFSFCIEPFFKTYYCITIQEKKRRGTCGGRPCVWRECSTQYPFCAGRLKNEVLCLEMEIALVLFIAVALQAQPLYPQCLIDISFQHQGLHIPHLNSSADWSNMRN